MPLAARKQTRCRTLLEALLEPIGHDAAIVANLLIEEFGSLGAVLAAPKARQFRASGRDHRAVRQLGIIRAAMMHVLRSKIAKGPVIRSWQDLIDYLTADMAHLVRERVRILFLNSRNGLIKDQIVAEGSVDEAFVYVREIMAQALEIGAVGIIIVHNHPSGEAQPSSSDINLTRNLIDAGRRLGVVVHDHIIIADGTHSSMRDLGLI